MKRLTGTDALFLSLETPSWHQHVGGLTILDPGDRPVTFEDVVDAIDARIGGAPKFRWKLKEMPLGLDRPVWVDDADFDIRRHVRRVGVPAPGGFKETAEVAGMILEPQLDRSRPLWEMWFLEGLAHGRVALLLKYHHCLLDGMAGASLATILMDLEPDAEGPLVDFPPPDEQSAGPEPSTAEALVRVASEMAQRPFRAARYAVRGSQKLLAGASAFRRGDRHGGLFGPDTPFNDSIGPRRALSFSSVSLDDVKELRVHHDVKVNDVVLALVGGALRQYLIDLDALPDESLVTGVPVSVRAEGDATHDNQISNMFVALGTDIVDPVERLRAIHTTSQAAKAMHQAMGARDIQSLGEVASPLILSTALRTVYATKLMARLPAKVNTIVSNVPGPPVPLYVCGARVTGIFPCSVILDGMGINTTVISYRDRIDFGFHVDPDLVPDPWAVAERIPEALAELKAASGLGPPTPVEDPFGEKVVPKARPKSTAGKAKAMPSTP
jgi:WS/DGAT/MGAT family acyltransferase